MVLSTETVTAKELRKANDQAVYSRLFEKMTAQKNTVEAAFYQKKLTSKRTAAENQAIYDKLLAQRELMNKEYIEKIRPSS